MKLLRGDRLALVIQASLQKEIKLLPVKPGLGVLLIGDNPSSQLYVEIKEMLARMFGAAFTVKAFPSDISTQEVYQAIDQFNHDKTIHGILLQLPLPKHLPADDIIARISPQKDVDGFLASSGVLSPTVQAILTLLHEAGVPLNNKTVCLLVNSEAFYQGLKEALISLGMSIIQDSSVADVVIVAKGQANFLHAAMLKQGVTIIDVGINVVKGKTVGDSASDVRQKAFALTPVPGGVGPLTVAYLFKNLVELSKRAAMHQ